MDTRRARFTDALPDEFPFYHLGQVRSDSAPGPAAGAVTPSEPEWAGVAFNLLGDAPGGLILVLFDKDLDVPTYTEMGNVLASRIADKLSRQSGNEVLISPPRALDAAQISRLVAGSRRPDEAVIRRDYHHIHRDQMVLVRTLILPAPMEGAAHA